MRTELTVMKWWNIERYGCRRVCLALSLLFLLPWSVFAAELESFMTENDSTVTPPAVSSLPPDSIRALARQLGMVDTSEVLLFKDTMRNVRYDSAQKKSFYERHRERTLRGWANLIPTQFTLQYAGSIGLMSVGIGWHYGRHDNWETELLVGFLPRYHSGEAHTTFTIKERYVPWHCHISRRWTIMPLTTGIFFNTISGDDFWKTQPEKYPKKYYGFSTKVRTNIFLGQRFCYHIPKRNRLIHQSISAYYEISSCDLYIVSKATNKEYPWSQTLSLAFGLLFEL